MRRSAVNLGITPQRLKEAMQKGDISIALEKMPEKDAKKLKSILGNPELIKKMMKSAQAQELKKIYEKSVMDGGQYE
ncbi:MAG: hypothetical protein ACLTZI_11550 [[Eubacterium] siraeum]